MPSGVLAKGHRFHQRGDALWRFRRAGTVKPYRQFAFRGHFGDHTMFLIAAVRILFTKLRDD